MNILIIEDDDNKINQLVDFLNDELKLKRIDITKSYQSGLRKLCKLENDIVILDMSMPMFDKSIDEPGGIFERFAGEKILREISRKDIKTKVIIFTMFESFGEGANSITLEQLKTKLSEEFYEYYVDTVYYNAAESKWKEDMKNILSKFIYNI